MDTIEVRPLRQLPRLDRSASYPLIIDRNIYNNITYDNFFNNHMRNNVPCIIKNIGTDWQACKKWVKNDKIDFDYLTNTYGNLMVPVVDCKKILFDNLPRTEMRLSDYITYFKGNSRDKMMYLRDWHLRRSKPDDRFYTVPKLFASDWLNEYCHDNHLDDFMFVYMGPAGSWTPMHEDVYTSFSWSVNVSGRKKWYLFPPGEEHKLKDNYKNVIQLFDPEKYKDKCITYYEIIQGQGEAIFVPSGWYHQVENEIDTISINHNWINGTNIVNVWLSLSNTIGLVKEEIDDLRDLEDFPAMAQAILKNVFGFDCEEFANFIVHIGEKRLAQIETGLINTCNNFTLGKNHCMYDLKCIQKVMDLMSEHHTFYKHEYIVSEKFVVLHDCLNYIF